MERDGRNWRIPGRQRDRARELRRASTDAERLIWSRLRAHRLEGLSFRRQKPIGPYIVDFLCPAARLVVEIDGGQHYEDRGLARDARRDAFLASEGFRVLRVSNREALTNPEGVLLAILEAAGHVLPPPNPPPRAGEG